MSFKQIFGRLFYLIVISTKAMEVHYAGFGTA
jgi:hypothetical protein